MLPAVSREVNPQHTAKICPHAARPFAMGYPFLDLPNVIGSPHNSAGGGAWRDEYLRRAVQNCRRAILGETPSNLIGSDERMI
jgi:phosphoglycerate dehydrogenase-like enzyme